MTFNTGNPIGSTDARDLSDNAENFDKALGTTAATWVDRFGVTRDSFEGRLAKGSFYRVGDFTTGYTLTNMRQTLEYSGHEYSWAGTFPKVVAAGATPATSGGIGAGAWVDRTDVTLRSEIKNKYTPRSDVSKLSDGLFSQGDYVLVTDRDWQLFKIESGTPDGYGKLDAGNGNVATLIPEKTTTVKSFGIPTDGVTNADAGLESLASIMSTVRFSDDGDEKLLITNIPNNLTWFQGGTLKFDVNEATTISLCDGIQFDKTKFYSTFRQGPKLTADNIILNDAFFGRGFPDTITLTRYNACTFEGCDSMRIKNLSSFESGIRLINCPNVNWDGGYIDINNVGFGLDAQSDGTDGIKFSALTSGNFSNIIIRNPSRDGIDGYTSGKELNLNNIKVYDFKFLGFEFKFQTSSPSNDDTPHEINISNIQFIRGGVGVNAPYSALSITNTDIPLNATRAPRRINISNVIGKNLFLNAGVGSVNSGYRLEGVDEINMSNVNLGYITGPTGGGQLYYAGVIQYCKNVTMHGCPTTGSGRGLVLNETDGVELHGCDIGFPKDGYTAPPTGIQFNGSNRKFKMFGGRIRGITNPIIGGTTTALIDSGFFYVNIVGGQNRIETFTNLKFHGCDIECSETAIDAIFSTTALPASDMEIIGGTIVGGRSGLNTQSITRLKAIGTTYIGYNSTSAIRGTTDGSSIITNNISKDATGSAAFPTATGKDIIANNI